MTKVGHHHAFDGLRYEVQEKLIHHLWSHVGKTGLTRFRKRNDILKHRLPGYSFIDGATGWAHKLYKSEKHLRRGSTREAVQVQLAQYFGCTESLHIPNHTE